MFVGVLCIAFILGSFPSGVVLSRAIAGRDVRQFGSGNPGASNVARTFGLSIGVAVGIIDILKGLLAVVIGRLLHLDSLQLSIVAAAAVIGHDYSVFLRFRGGKGVATTLGAALALGPIACVLAMLIWAAVIYTTGYSSLASLVSLGALPFFLALTRSPAPIVAVCIALFLLAVWKHRENISRLWNGTERKFGTLTPANGA